MSWLTVQFQVRVRRTKKGNLLCHFKNSEESKSPENWQSKWTGQGHHVRPANFKNTGLDFLKIKGFFKQKSIEQKSYTILLDT